MCPVCLRHFNPTHLIQISKVILISSMDLFSPWNGLSTCPGLWCWIGRSVHNGWIEYFWKQLCNLCVCRMHSYQHWIYSLFLWRRRSISTCGLLDLASCHIKLNQFCRSKKQNAHKSLDDKTFHVVLLGNCIILIFSLNICRTKLQLPWCSKVTF